MDMKVTSLGNPGMPMPMPMPVMMQALPGMQSMMTVMMKQKMKSKGVASLEEAFHFVKDDNSDLPIATPNDSSEALSVLAFNSNDRNKMQD